ncbi:alpha/beta hydrolase [Streptomyces sp. ME03-5709C]|nr:alpha/beta hydrolase [Streptomyces sp. ME03-5709C]
MTTADNSRPAILLVPGAWHGAWCFDRLVPELTALGWRVETVDLPSASADAANTAGMYDDARAVRERLDALEGPVTVLAHSYAGIPVTQAAADAANVSRIVYLSAFVLDEGESIDGLSGGHFSGAGVNTLSADEHHKDARSAFYADVAPQDADEATSRLVLQTIKSFCEPVTAAAWKTVPSTYIVTEQDTALVPEFQESMAARAQRTHRLPSGHSSFLSMPVELAALITADAGR